MEAALSGMAYGMLFVLGAVLGVVGAFTHDVPVSCVLPVVACGWVVVLFAVSFGAGRMMRSKAGAAAVAVGWLPVTMVLAITPAAGDVVFTHPAGTVYVYGGLGAIAVAFLLAPSSGGSWLLRGYSGNGGIK
ncbi:DUF6113 family protein [Thermoactinospora rubra]|uniref:DUF6113 family protein n=1 Tax=Thermoactinospora rubra TaxID=1088767 RepID=UPI00117D0879|nr:DUF6113 family protein [Thermoactinospora rubra]